MISIELPKDLEDRLNSLAKITGKSRSIFVRDALKAYLQENENALMTIAKLEQSMAAASIDTAGQELQDRHIGVKTATDKLIDERAIAVSQRSHVRILLAEDSPINRMVTLVMLKKLGYQVDAVKNGLEAVNALETTQYDLALMDCQMPKMDGYEATRLIRRGDSPVLNHDIPIVAITAHATEEDRISCMEAGMNEHIAKPLQPKDIEEVVARLFGRAAAGQEVTMPDEARQPQPVCNAEEIREVFNETRLIERFTGDRDVCREILTGFVDDIPKEIGLLGDLLAAGDALAGQGLAHAIRGAATNVEAVAMRSTAHEIERAASRGEIDMALIMCVHLEEQFELFKTTVVQTGWVRTGNQN